MPTKTKFLLILLFALVLASPLIVNMNVFDEELTAPVAEILNGSPTVQADTGYRDVLALADDAVPILEAEQSNYTACSARTQLGCLDVLRDDLLAAPVARGGALDGLLKRYRRLAENGNYRGPSDPGAPYSHWGPTLKLAALDLARRSLVNDNFVEAVSQDLQFWQQVYKNGNSMLDKMVGVAGLWTTLQFSSEYVNLETVPEADAIRLASLAGSVRLDLKRMVTPFDHEFRIFTAMMDPAGDFLPGNTSLLERHFGALMLQPNATSNRFYRRVISPVLCQLELSVGDLHRGGASRCLNTESGWGFVIYNPYGKLSIEALGTLGDYVYRVHDLNTLAGLVAYQLTQGAGRSPNMEDHVPNEVQVTQAVGEISFECLDRHSVCKLTTSP